MCPEAHARPAFIVHVLLKPALSREADGTAKSRSPPEQATRGAPGPLNARPSTERVSRSPGKTGTPCRAKQAPSTAPSTAPCTVPRCLSGSDRPEAGGMAHPTKINGAGSSSQPRSAQLLRGWSQTSPAPPSRPRDVSSACSARWARGGVDPAALSGPTRGAFGRRRPELIGPPAGLAVRSPAGPPRAEARPAAGASDSRPAGRLPRPLFTQRPGKQPRLGVAAANADLPRRWPREQPSECLSFNKSLLPTRFLAARGGLQPLGAGGHRG